MPYLDDPNHEAALASLLSTAPKDVIEQVDATLLNIAAMSNPGGREIAFDLHTDAPLAFAKEAGEANYILRQLGTAGLLKIEGSMGGQMRLEIPLRGWHAVRELRAKNVDSGVAFVAMPFAAEFSDLYSKGIKAGIESAGFDSLRIDSVSHSGRIDDRILAEIRRARFLVVDTTKVNRNVLFEAGFALGLGKTVIWTCRKQDSEELANVFDIRQYNHIMWEPGKETVLAERLAAAIGNIVGKR